MSAKVAGARAGEHGAANRESTSSKATLLTGVSFAEGDWSNSSGPFAQRSRGALDRDLYGVCVSPRS